MNELNDKLKVVAEYMGYKTLSQSDGVIVMEDEDGYAGHIEAICSKYNESFDVLMPVAKKLYDELNNDKYKGVREYRIVAALCNARSYHNVEVLFEIVYTAIIYLNYLNSLKPTT